MSKRIQRTPDSAARTFAISLTILALAGAPPALAQENEEVEAVEEIIVQATRSGRRAQDEPIRVEVINREEIEEKILMRPGNIAMLLSETGGLKVQVTSPALGSSNIRVQGMRGRYTQLLTDGLPLYGGQASSIGLLQIPPTDLGQVEVIKGAASALYGPSALGGVINLVSRRPGTQPQTELLLNGTSRDGQDLTAYQASPLSANWSQSLTLGLHRQTRHDLDSDGWADIPGYGRWTVRPRLFWDGDSGATALVTLGAMGETRRGGTLPGRSVPDGTPFTQAQNSQRFDGGASASFPVGDLGKFHLRASGVSQDHRHIFGPVIEDDRHQTLFGEASFSTETGATSWLGGVAVQDDTYRSDTFSTFNYKHSAPALFGQVEHDLWDEVTLAGSARLDFQNVYGSRFSPRLSALYRPGAWTFRASMGRGFYAPTPFVEEIEATGLSRLRPLTGLKAEVAETVSLEGGYAEGGFEANVILFTSNIHRAVRLETVGPASVRLENVTGDTRTKGTELLLRHRWESFSITGSYVYVDAREPFGPGTRAIPLTPRHTGGIVAMWEEHDVGRFGFEAYYTGKQELEDNPYRTRSRPYFELGALGELNFGNYSLFLNLENLLDIRQTRYDRFLLPARASDGRWTVDAWAPMDGFVANAGVRIRL